MKVNDYPVHHLKADIEGELLLEVLARSGLQVPTDCSGLGKCGRCRVRLLQGKVSPLCSEEKECLDKGDLEDGFRLACMCTVSGDVTVSVPDAGMVMQIEAQGQACDFEFDPVIKKQYLVLSPLENESLYQCLIRQAGTLSTDCLKILQVLPVSPTALSTVKYNDTLIGVEPGNTCAENFGIAVDIGTTTVAAQLIDLNTGESRSSATAINPQFQLGADVLSRIHYAQQDASRLAQLSALIQNKVNALVGELCDAAGVERASCYVITIAANTVMLHLFLGINPELLGSHPYRPAFLETLVLKASDLGIQAAPFAVLQCLPGLSAFVGADIQAGLLSLDLTAHRENVLFVDMGTNGEIVLCAQGRMIATSTAAGPAFEGMNISCGMKASPGAVDHVDFQNGKLTWSVIGEKDPEGLCGSGLLDLTAALVEQGIIQKSGRIIDPEKASVNGVCQMEKSRCFQLVKPAGTGLSANDSASSGGVYLSQKDVRQVQLAKGSLGAGMKLLIKEAGLALQEIRHVYLAGGFGRYLKPETFISLGLFPAEWQDRIIYAGNTALSGSRISMLSAAREHRHREKLKNVEFFDLTACDDFNRVFAGEMYFPK